LYLKMLRLFRENHNILNLVTRFYKIKSD
jgi:hypothetical protein